MRDLRFEAVTIRSGLWTRLKRDRFLFLLVAPALVHYVVFRLLPMGGITIAFMDFSAYDGYFGSPWVGLKHFQRFFSTDAFWRLFRNTLAISLMRLGFFFPFPIVLAVLLNEIRSRRFKGIIQTVVYLPHFLSWVVIFGVTYLMLSQSEGLVNKALVALGADTYPFMTKQRLFWPLVTAQVIWKEAGWGTIIFLAAIGGIDPNLYEAARVDGAKRLRQVWHITLPSIRSIIMVLLILDMGRIIDVSFQQLYLMGNSAVMDVADVFDTYVFRTGIGKATLATARRWASSSLL